MTNKVPPPPSFGATRYSTGPAVSKLGQANTNATAAMWFGIATLVFCPALFAPFALVAGLKGYKAAGELGGEGAGKSLFAIVVGALALVLTAVLVIAYAASSAQSVS